MKRIIAGALLCALLLCGCSGRNAAEYRTPEGVDLDLTHLSGTMVYAEVFNMRYEPDDYYGKVIRIQGLFAANRNPDTGEYYFNCIIPDATACCSQGIQFFPSDDLRYPEDFPENGATITVCGTYDVFSETAYMGGLLDADMEISADT